MHAAVSLAAHSLSEPHRQVPRCGRADLSRRLRYMFQPPSMRFFCGPRALRQMEAAHACSRCSSGHARLCFSVCAGALCKHGPP